MFFKHFYVNVFTSMVKTECMCVYVSVVVVVVVIVVSQ